MLLYALCLAQICPAQKEGNIWYFGNHAGLDFNTVPPVPLPGTATIYEGSASVADPVTGSLLFYTDGVTVWDRNHNQMPANIANPLRGSTTSTQSALIVPQPGSNTRYYIFTVAAVGSGHPYVYPMCYSIVDLSLNGGNGDLLSWNNTLLADSTTEKLAAVGNCDRSQFWIVGHRWNTDEFFAYRLTSTGLSAPVVSKTGIVHTEHIGYMKFSSDGSRLGLVMAVDVQGAGINTVELLDFDFATGTVSNPITDPITSITSPVPSFNSLYGCSFSPDGSKFYASAAMYIPQVRKVFQYDLTAGSPVDILASRVDVAVPGDSVFITGALQNGRDGKLYIVNRSGSVLDIIHNPNEAGAACNYQPEAVPLNGGQGTWGLPNIVESFLTPPPAPEFRLPGKRGLCLGDTLWAPQQPHTFSIWPATGVWVSPDSTLAGFSPGTTTTYTVVSSSRCAGNDTVTFTVQVSAGPEADFVFSPGVLQPSDPLLTLSNQSLRAFSYQWYDDSNSLLSSDKNYTLPHPGLGHFCYTLVASDSIGCTDTARRCIEVKDHGALLIPNTFSPNGDGLNDVFRIYGLYRELLEFSVYNRYGERIFYTTDKASGWDGYYRGERCDMGTYYYRIRLVNGNGQQEIWKGDINLIF